MEPNRYADFSIAGLSTAVPTTQAKRQALLLSLKNFFKANPDMEVNTPKVIVTSALAGTLFTALPNARVAAADGNTDAGKKSWCAMPPNRPCATA